MGWATVIGDLSQKSHGWKEGIGVTPICKPHPSKYEDDAQAYEHCQHIYIYQRTVGCRIYGNLGIHMMHVHSTQDFIS